MIDTTLEQQLHDELEHLAPDKQRQVLDYARSLNGGTPRGIPGRELVLLESPFTPEELRAIAQAIEEDCEHVGPDEW